MDVNFKTKHDSLTNRYFLKHAVDFSDFRFCLFIKMIFSRIVIHFFSLLLSLFIFWCFFPFICLSNSESAASRFSLDQLHYFQLLTFIKDCRTDSGAVFGGYRYSGFSVCCHACKSPSDGSAVLSCAVFRR